MIDAKVRIGPVQDQDRFRREDLQAMSPEERIMTLVRLRDRQFGSTAKRIRDSGVFSCRQFAASAEVRSSNA
jgi:hypothetical protein